MVATRGSHSAGGWETDHRFRAAATEAGSMVESSDRLRPVILKPDRGSIHLREMLRHMARLGTDGLTLPELLIECDPSFRQKPRF